MGVSIPSGLCTDVDLWAGDALENPMPIYKQLRDAGPVIWLSKVSSWGVFRFDAVREVLSNPAIFSSGKGVMLNDFMNKATSEAGVILCSDDPRHRSLRRVFARPLTPAAVSKLRPRLAEMMAAHVDRLFERKSFDAIKDLAQFLPLTVVKELVGLTSEGKDNMLVWAAGAFDAFGPDTSPRTHAGAKLAAEMLNYILTVRREDLDPDGWGAAVFLAADAGEISHDDARSLLSDYLTPALDTTIIGLGGAIRLFAENPDQWSLLRNNPSLIPGAIDEAIRLQSPIRAFGRQLTEDYCLGGVELRASDRVHVFYASANRDERHYPEPDRFLIERRAKDHVGFGYGHHLCAGMNLAKLEIEVALRALLSKVERISINECVLSPHNTLNVIEKLNVTVS